MKVKRSSQSNQYGNWHKLVRHFDKSIEEMVAKQSEAWKYLG